MRKTVIVVAAVTMLVSTSALAADMAVKALPAAVWDWAGFYIGAGGSYNWTLFDQALQGVSGIQNITIGPGLVAQAQEGGPFFDFNRNKSGFAPDVQLGYIVPFAGNDWLAGLKFNYKYANIDSKENVNVPQAGTLTTVVGPPTTENITGFVQVNPAEINLRHQLALIATIGRAFDKLIIYAGGGPALFGVETNFTGTAFAIINGIWLPLPARSRSASRTGIGCGAARRRLARPTPSLPVGSWILPTPMRGLQTSTLMIQRALGARSGRLRAAGVES